MFLAAQSPACLVRYQQIFFRFCKWL